MKVVYNIKVEKNVCEEDQQWLKDNNLLDAEALSRHILKDEGFIDDLLRELGANQLLYFKADIVEDK